MKKLDLTSKPIDPYNGNELVSKIMTEITNLIYARIQIPPEMEYLENFDNKYPYYVRKTFYKLVEWEIYKDTILPIGIITYGKDVNSDELLRSHHWGIDYIGFPQGFERRRVVKKDPQGRYKIRAEFKKFILQYNEDLQLLYYTADLEISFVDVSPEVGVWIDIPLSLLHNYNDEKYNLQYNLFELLHTYYVEKGHHEYVDKVYGSGAKDGKNKYRYDAKNLYDWYPLKKRMIKVDKMEETNNGMEKTEIRTEIKVENKVEEKSEFYIENPMSIQNGVIEYFDIQDKSIVFGNEAPYYGMYHKGKTDTNNRIAVVQLLQRFEVTDIVHTFDWRASILDAFGGVLIPKLKVELVDDQMNGKRHLFRHFPIKPFETNTKIFEEDPRPLLQAMDYLANDKTEWWYHDERPSIDLLGEKVGTFQQNIISTTPESIRFVDIDATLDEKIRNGGEDVLGENVQDSITSKLAKLQQSWKLFWDSQEVEMGKRDLIFKKIYEEMSKNDTSVMDRLKSQVKHIHAFFSIETLWEYLQNTLGIEWGAWMSRKYFSFDSRKQLDPLELHPEPKPGTYVRTATVQPNLPHRSSQFTPKYIKIEYKEPRLNTLYNSKYSEEMKDVEDVTIVNYFGTPSNERINRVALKYNQHSVKIELANRHFSELHPNSKILHLHVAELNQKNELEYLGVLTGSKEIPTSIVAKCVSKSGVGVNIEYNIELYDEKDLTRPLISRKTKFLIVYETFELPTICVVNIMEESSYRHILIHRVHHIFPITTFEKVTLKPGNSFKNQLIDFVSKEIGLDSKSIKDKIRWVNMNTFTQLTRIDGLEERAWSKINCYANIDKIGIYRIAIERSIETLPKFKMVRVFPTSLIKNIYGERWVWKKFKDEAFEWREIPDSLDDYYREKLNTQMNRIIQMLQKLSSSMYDRPTQSQLKTELDILASLEVESNQSLGLKSDPSEKTNFSMLLPLDTEVSYAK